MARPDLLPDLSGLTILVADDNDDSLDVVATYLRACGAHVLHARNALAGLSFLDTQPRIDAVVTALSMPGIDGLQLVRRLRSHPRGRPLPAIALSGIPAHRMDTHRAAFDAFLGKPVDFDALCRIILNVVGQR